MRIILSIIAAAMATAGLFAQDAELTNYKSGIDVTWGGTKGVDYMEEYLYHDKLIDDHKVVYIRDTTTITMGHNARNTAIEMPNANFLMGIIGANGRDGIADSGDEGIIRYKLDRDRQYNYVWADSASYTWHGRLLPAYTTPFTLASQVYTDQWEVTINAATDLVTFRDVGGAGTSVPNGGIPNTTLLHGIPDGTAVTFPYLFGGSGLSTGTTYYTRDATGMSFKVAASPGGAAINVTGNYGIQNTANTPTTPRPGTIVRLVATPPVVGTTGPNNTSYGSRVTCYFRGLTDTFGDEWHTLSYADDSNVFLRNYPAFVDNAFYADDGKTVMLVVNPRTPGLTVRATGDAQFFTTPPKAYWTPKIVDQTTYFNAGTGTVTFEIRDLYGNNVFYRVGGGSFIDAGTNHVTLDQDDFSAGSNTLQYYYAGNVANTKTRIVVKNPTHPSLAETHGTYLWTDGTGYNTVLQRIQSQPYKKWYDLYKGNRDQSGQLYWDQYAGQGLRYAGASYRNMTQGCYALENAFVAKVEGANYKIASSPKTHMRYAIEMLLDHQRTIDKLGFEMWHTSDAVPCREVHYRGYYDSSPTRDALFAYDIVAANFRSDQVAGGMTAIEDYFIRDWMAGFVYEAKQWGASMCAIGDPALWGGVRMNAGAYVAMILSEYSTPYYGTSGFGAAQTTYPLCPYQDDQYTWKQALFDINTQSKKHFPNFKFEGRWNQNGPSGASSLVDLFFHADEAVGWEAGDYRARSGYYSTGTGGLHFTLWANMAKRYAGGVTDPLLELSFTRAANGLLRSYQDDVPQPAKWFPLPLLLNDQWPEIAAINVPRISALPATDANSFDKLMQDAGVYGFAWMDVSYTGETPPPSAPAAVTGLSAAVNSNSQITLSWTNPATNETYVQVERSTDNTTWPSSVQIAANATSYAATGLTGGTLYYFRVRNGNVADVSDWVTTSATTTADTVAPPPPTNNARRPGRPSGRGAKGPL